MKKLMIFLLLIPVFLLSIEIELNWTNYYGGDDSDCFLDGIITTDENILMCGYTRNAITMWHDLYLVKTDFDGNIIWEVIYEGTFHDEGIEINETADGDYIVLVDAEYTRLIKFNSMGELLWLHDYPDYYAMKDFIITDDDGILVFGSIIDEYYWFLKLDENGQEVWSQNNELSFLTMRIGEKLLKCNNSDDFFWIYSVLNQTNFDGAIEKLDSEGNIIWECIISTDDNFYVSSVTKKEDNYLVTGINNDIFFQGVVNSDGELIDSYNIDVQITSSVDFIYTQNIGNIYLGHSNVPPNNYIIGITNNDQQLVWQGSFLEENGYDIPYAIISNSNDKFLVIGQANIYDNRSQSQGFLAEFQLDPTSLHENEIIQPTPYLTNYPNPFNPTTTIEFSIQNNSHIELSIYNIKGQTIKTLTQNEFSKGTHKLIWNGDDEFEIPVSSGVYFYKLKVNDKIELMKKCLLLK